MESVMETAVFAEIQAAQSDAKYNVIEALYAAYDKIDCIREYSENAEEFSIVQESFTKPDKNESTAVKIALAAPRAMYRLIKLIIDGFKNIFKRHKKPQTHFTTQNVEHTLKIVDNITKDKEAMKLICGAVAGTGAAIAAFFKKRSDNLKKRLETYRETRAAEISTRAKFETAKRKSEESYKDIVALFVRPDNTIGISLMIDLDHIRTDKIPKHYFRGILENVEMACRHADGYDSKSKFDDFMKRVKLDIENIPFIYEELRPDPFHIKNYDTYEDFQKSVEAFANAEFKNEVEDLLTEISKYIRMAYQSYEKKIEKAEKKSDKLEEEAYKKYCDDIGEAIYKHLHDMQTWCTKLVAFVDTAHKEFIEKVKDEATKIDKMKPFVGGDTDKTLQGFDRDQWDELQLKEAKEKLEKKHSRTKDEKSEDKEEDKSEKDDKKDEKPSEEKSDNDKDEKESDD